MCHDCDSRVTYSLIAPVRVRVFGGAGGLVMEVISVLAGISMLGVVLNPHVQFR